MFLGVEHVFYTEMSKKRQKYSLWGKCTSIKLFADFFAIDKLNDWKLKSEKFEKQTHFCTFEL